MADKISSEEARAALAQAEDAAQRVRAQARWMSTYLGVFAAGFGAAILVLGLVQPLALRLSLWAVAWALLVTAMIIWASRRPAGLPGTGRRVVPYWLATAVLYSVAMFVGTPRFIGHPLYWLPAALVVAAPLAIGAVRERRV